MNKSRIEQCYLSDSLRWFKDGFRARYGLGEYTDPEAPCIFVGVYGRENIDLILAHKGFKVVMFCGADIVNAVELSKDLENISGFLSDMHIYEQAIKKRIPVNRYLTIPMKSFEMFEPCPLGDKIYFYARVKKEQIERKFKMRIVENVIRHFGKDRVLLGYQGNTIEAMKTDFYERSFINLNFTREVGFTSCLEMAHMGRKSISNYPAWFCSPYKFESSIIRMIEKEATKIGTVREDIAKSAREYYSATDDWMNVDFWK